MFMKWNYDLLVLKDAVLVGVGLYIHEVAILFFWVVYNGFSFFF